MRNIVIREPCRSKNNCLIQKWSWNIQYNTWVIKCGGVRSVTTFLWVTEHSKSNIFTNCFLINLVLLFVISIFFSSFLKRDILINMFKKVMRNLIKFLSSKSTHSSNKICYFLNFLILLLTLCFWESKD